MAANIEFRNDKYSFVETNKGAGAWHGLGEKVEVEGDTGIDIKRALEMSQANYHVDLQPVVALTPALVEAMGRDEMINAGDLLRNVIKGVKSTMRTDTNKSLGIVSEGYGVLQNERMFQVLGMIASGKDMNREDVPVVETAGVLGGGERCFVTMKFPEPIRLNTSKDDIVNMYLVATNSHNGLGTFKLMVSPTRVVCSNTLTLAERTAKSTISFRHTRLINERVDMLSKENAEMAFQGLGMYDTYRQYIEAELDTLRKIKANDKWAEMVMAEALLTDDVYDIYKKNNFSMNSEDISTRSKNMIANAMEVMESGIGQDNPELKGTGLHIINGLTTFFQNEMKWKDGEKKFLSITEGGCYDKLQVAHRRIKALAEVA